MDEFVEGESTREAALHGNLQSRVMKFDMLGKLTLPLVQTLINCMDIHALRVYGG